MAIQEEMRINSNLLPVLPTDITIDILSWLSAESVLTCKRVCKTWRALIDDIAFAQAHTGRLEKQQQQKPEALEFFLSPDNTVFGKYNFGEHTHGDITFKLHKSITHDYPFPLPFQCKGYYRSHCRPVSSCNGLLCLISKVVDYYNSYICVYNPLTREYVNLPILTYEQPLVGDNYLHSSRIKTGFGYHPCTKEYKVVQIYYNIDDGSPQGQVSVYTLGSGSSSSSSSGGWRSKGEIDFMLFGPGVLVNGALHWLKCGDRRRMEIIAFDLAEEKLRIVPSPPSPPQPSPGHHGVALEVLEGRYLCVMISTSKEKLCSMWVMNQDHSSWTKKYSNIALNVPDNILCLRNYRPLAHSKGGNILMYDPEYSQMKIVSSELKNTSFDDEDVHVISLVRLLKRQLNVPYSHYYDEIIPYTKSFVSLKAFKARLSKRQLNAPYSHSHCYYYDEIIPYTKSFVSLKALGEEGARTGGKAKELIRGANDGGETQQKQPRRKRRKRN